jgi:hypothetical protein
VAENALRVPIESARARDAITDERIRKRKCCRVSRNGILGACLIEPAPDAKRAGGPWRYLPSFRL